MAYNTLYVCLILISLLPLARLAMKPKPATCADVRSKYQVHQNGYYTIYDSTNKPYLAFCDFRSDPGFSWTLIESISRGNAQTSNFRKSFQYNIPSNECTPNWSNYRLSKAKLATLHGATSSTHFRATCNFDSQSKTGLTSHRDYLRVSFCAYNYFLTNRGWTCAIVDYINIRGYSCSKCSIPFYSDSNNHLQSNIAYSKTKCGKFNVPDAVADERIFGNYYSFSEKFSCVTNSTSTTNWWIGGAIYD
ncbi:hypothetical protein TrispH2_001764 [Trichoplax sp. H2]|nr:hypothetical protein TrispH2_001764 [Trichoplax sp. H2]|eukprot:RDD46106.1 hypothetical protein TrispH2_001764 [Trichoplax sp. H2]